MEYEYLLIARHGNVDDLTHVREVTRRLVETLEELKSSRWRLLVTAVEHASTEQSRLTAEVYANGLELEARAGDVALGPRRFPPYAPERARKQVQASRDRIDGRLKPGAAVLLVGHEPAIDWVLDGWVDRPIALAAAEIACLARAADRRGRWHLWWVLTPSDAAAIEPLRSKVASKMTVLSVLAGFTLAVTGAVLIDLPSETGPRLLAGGAAACFAVAAAAYVCTLLAYDELIMPPRFWRGGSPSATPRGPLGPGVVARPPSSAGIVIFQHMTALWRWVVGALALSGVGVVLLALSRVWANGVAPTVAVAYAAVVLALAVALWWLTHQPRLGTED